MTESNCQDSQQAGAQDAEVQGTESGAPAGGRRHVRRRR